MALHCDQRDCVYIGSKTFNDLISMCKKKTQLHRFFLSIPGSPVKKFISLNSRKRLLSPKVKKTFTAKD